MRRLTVIAAAALTMLVSVAADAQVRGTGRLQGNVTDKATGKAITGATITISLPSGNTRPITAKSDGRGHWAALGMTPGVWNIDITAPGYVTSRGTANISELGQTPAINIQLEPEAQQAAPAAVETAPSVPKEAVDAINEGQTLLRAQAASADEAKANAQKAVADFEKALPLVPDTTDQLKEVRNQIMAVMAQAYYKAGDVKSSITTLEKLDLVDPTPAGATPDAAHATRDVLLANLYLENGQLEQGRALLDKLPATAITDPTAYINIGILFLNKKNPKDAVTYFTKAVDLDPKKADAYYYRGLALIQMKKDKEAKADLQQVLALAPSSSEANDAKQLLASLK